MTAEIFFCISLPLMCFYSKLCDISSISKFSFILVTTRVFSGAAIIQYIERESMWQYLTGALGLGYHIVYNQWKHSACCKSTELWVVFGFQRYCWWLIRPCRKKECLDDKMTF